MPRTEHGWGTPWRHRGHSHAFERAGIRAGDVLRAEVRRPGEVALIRDADPIEQLAGSLTGVFAPDELDALRDEWA